MAEMSMTQISDACKGKIVAGDPSQSFSHIVIDSRKLSNASHALFIAIKGERHDGHQYVQQLYDKGIRLFVVETSIDVSTFPEACFCQVASSVEALQNIAAVHRAAVSIPVIGITGSNGKTVVKEWLNTILAGDFVIARSPRSYNSQIGVPLSVWNLDVQHTLGIFEAGISQPGEMENLQKVIQPTMGIFTHLGDAHVENFTSRLALAEEKMKLFSASQTLIYCGDDSSLVRTLQNPLYGQVEKIAWGYTLTDELRAGLFIERKDLEADYTLLTCTWKGVPMNFSFAFIDAASVENAISCITCLLVMGYEQEVIADRLDRLSALHMRLEVLEGSNHAVLINDAYSSDIQSLEIALDFLKANSGQKKRVAILSDIAQTGLSDEDLCKRLNSILLSKEVNELIAIGARLSGQAASFQLPTAFYPTTENFIERTEVESFSSKAILIKGARAFGFERITSLLQEKTHETRLEIDLGAMINNLNYFRSRIRPQTKLMVMVKAFGYGSGAKEVASLLEFNRVDYLAVAYADEGVELRKAGISLPIMVMNPEPGTFDVIVRYHLEPEIYSMHVLEMFKRELTYHSLEAPFPVHIKIDSGMHRLGFMPHEVEGLCDVLSGAKEFYVASVFTHLSSSENPDHDFFTRRQLSDFESACEMIAQRTNKSFLRHALNTGGIQRFPEAQYEMVRLGIGLYGVASHVDEQSELHAVSTFRTRVSQIKKIVPGDAVGYGMSFIATHPMTIAIIPVGYADGLRRSLSNGKGYVIIRGRKAVIVGRVCMDMTMVDVTEIHCAEGDDVELFGNKLPLHEFAEMSGTIPYEILTSINQRVKRIYVQE